MLLTCAGKQLPEQRLERDKLGTRYHNGLYPRYHNGSVLEGWAVPVAPAALSAGQA